MFYHTGKNYYSLIDAYQHIFKDVLSVTFDDVTSDNCAPYVTPSIEDVKSILDWSKDKDDIIVHCTAGISRSSAIAYLIEYEKTKSFLDALETLNYVLHCPNKLIVCQGAAIFKNFDIFSALLSWEKENQKRFLY